MFVYENWRSVQSGSRQFRPVFRLYVEVFSLIWQYKGLSDVVGFGMFEVGSWKEVECEHGAEGMAWFEWKCCRICGYEDYFSAFWWLLGLFCLGLGLSSVSR